MNNTKSELQGELDKMIEKLEEFRVEESRKWHDLSRLEGENLTGLTDTPLHRQACIRSRNHDTPWVPADGEKSGAGWIEDIKGELLGSKNLD